jgi:hypothetical protein
MAANRTFKFYGQGYGDSPISIVAKINATTIFSGEISTIPGPAPDSLPEQLIFELADSSALGTDFAGSLPMTITLTSDDSAGFATFRQINCNYMSYTNPVFSIEEVTQLQDPTTSRDTIVDIRSAHAVPPFTAEEITFLKEHNASDPVEKQEAVALVNLHGVTTSISSADEFLPCYRGLPVNSESTADTRSSVVIAGVAQPDPHTASMQGTWTWGVEASKTFAYNWNITQGMVNGVSGVGSSTQSTY